MHFNHFSFWKSPVWEAPDAATGMAESASTTLAEPPATGSLITSSEPPAATSTETQGAQEGNENGGGATADAPDNSPATISMEDLSLPEGLAIPEESQEGFLSILNNPDLTKPQMINELLKMQQDSMVAQQNAAIEEWQNTRNGWREQAQALPEIGGDKLNETLATIKSGLEAAGATNEAFAALDVTGAGDHPAIISLMRKLVEPFLETPPVPGNPETVKPDVATRFYPSMAKKD